MSNEVMGCKYFTEAGPSRTVLFNVDECEGCGCDIEAPNRVTLIDVPYSDVSHLLFVSPEQMPPAGGYNDLIGGSACYDCDSKNQSAADWHDDEPAKTMLDFDR